jgi:hypothetical protein
MRFLTLSFIFTLSMLHAQVSNVTIRLNDSKWTLYVNEEPYYIRGGGGTVNLEQLKAAGGNTIRTWGIEQAQEILDQAQKLGLKVMLGYWIQHERHGFDYNDSIAVQNQFKQVREAVLKYKDHPALLMWGIGNEYELAYSNTAVWRAVNDIAKMVHEIDPHHPTSTVTAGTSLEKLKFVKKELTAIDIYGINTYGDIETVQEKLDSGGYTGPYMITEWGPNGHWESPKTPWGMSLEQTSTEKATCYLNRYTNFISANKQQCIGSFAFLWGQKQEYTHTWYGLFTENGQSTEAIDALTLCWKGNYPENRTPQIDSVKIDDKKDARFGVFLARSKHQITIYAHDLEGDKLHYEWELYPESTDLKMGGDAELKPMKVEGRIINKNSASIFLKSPNKEGKYRLFLFVSDASKVAYLNIPFQVITGKSKAITIKTADLNSFNND